jgi:hypothetical protein
MDIEIGSSADNPQLDGIGIGWISLKFDDAFICNVTPIGGGGGWRSLKKAARKRDIAASRAGE